MRLSKEFFAELSWWEDNLSTRNGIPLIRPLQPVEATISGTDASNIGCGSVVWMSGGREEYKQFWSDAERKFPINMRELIGATRILENWGPRLKNKRVILETDNMATVWCIRRRHARTELMAEQLRRLYAVATQWGIEL